jgi:GNAT superfamily N-acetyltransferase
VVGVVDADGVARVVTAGTRGDGRGSVDDDTVFAWRGDDGEVDRIADRYRDAHARLLGLVVQKSWEAKGVAPGTPIACIVLQPGDSRDEAEITSLAVLHDWRRQGFARALIFGACEHWGLRAVEPRPMPTLPTSTERSAWRWKAQASGTRASSGSGAGSSCCRGDQK